MPRDQKRDKECEDHWTKKINDALKGKTIKEVRYLTKKECDESMWYKRPVQIIFTDGHFIIPMADDEGNDGGAMETSIKEIGGVIPVI